MAHFRLASCMRVCKNFSMVQLIIKKSECYFSFLNSRTHKCANAKNELFGLLAFFGTSSNFTTTTCKFFACGFYWRTHSL